MGILYELGWRKFSNVFEYDDLNDYNELKDAGFDFKNPIVYKFDLTSDYLIRVLPPFRFLVRPSTWTGHKENKE